MSSFVTRAEGDASRAISGSVTRPVFRIAPDGSPSSCVSVALGPRLAGGGYQLSARCRQGCSDGFRICAADDPLIPRGTR